MKYISKIICLFKKITTYRDVSAFKVMQIFTLKLKGNQFFKLNFKSQTLKDEYTFINHKALSFFSIKEASFQKIEKTKYKLEHNPRSEKI